MSKTCRSIITGSQGCSDDTYGTLPCCGRPDWFLLEEEGDNGQRTDNIV